MGADLITTRGDAVTVIPPQIDLMTLGGVLAKSGYFTDARDEAQAVVKVLAGQEMGIGAIAAMTGIYIVKNKVQVGANILAGLVKRSLRYDYRVKVLTDTECVLTFFERNHDGKFEPIGESKFDKQDAIKAEVGNLGKFPRNMLFARAMSNGVKWFCADVTGGTTVYTPGELPNAPMCDVMTGEVIEPPAATAPAEASSVPAQPAQASEAACTCNAPAGKKHLKPCPLSGTTVKAEPEQSNPPADPSDPKAAWQHSNKRAAAIFTAAELDYSNRALCHVIADDVLQKNVASYTALTAEELDRVAGVVETATAERKAWWQDRVAKAEAGPFEAIPEHPASPQS